MSELTLKLSVDATDLDKVEAQLKRISDLLINTGMKKPAIGGFVSDISVFKPKGYLEPVFEMPFGATFINEASIQKCDLGEVMRKAAKKGAEEGAKQAKLEITTGVNYDCEQLNATVGLDAKNEDDKISGILYVDKLQAPALSVLANAKETTELIEKSQSEYEETKKRLDKRFNEIQSLIARIDQAAANGIDVLSGRISNLDARADKIETAIATSVRTLREEIARARSGW